MKPNLTYIKQLANGNVAFERRILGVLKRELPEEVESFREALRKLDYVSAAMLVHKIKHKVSLLGMENGYDLTTKFEDELRDGDVKKLAEFEQILDIMKTYLEGINTETE